MEEKNWLHLYSIFDIAGNKETGITKTFGVILRKDKTLLNRLIELVMPRKIKLSKSGFEKTNFYFEKSSAEGRTDIEIINDKIHIIIESKIGTGSVKFKQADRYCRKLRRSKSTYKCFVFLTEIGNLEIDRNLKKKYPEIVFGNISWDKTLELLHIRRDIQINLVKEYENYILEAQNMKIYDIDIWAVKVIGEQLKNFDDENIYINNKRHSPILIGKREWDSDLQRSIIRELKPVIKILDKDTHKYKKYRNDYIYQLGPALKLERPIIRKKRFGQAGAIALKFSDLELR